MPSWRFHDKWALRFRVPQDTSTYVNNIIDFAEEEEESNLPKEYLEYVDETANLMGIAAQDRILSMFIRAITVSHDSARRKETIGEITSSIQLGFLRKKGNHYINAWHLHHAMDYLKHDIRDNPNIGIDISLERLKKNYPHVYSDDIAYFILNNIEEIKDGIKQDIIEQSMYYEKGTKRK